MSLRSIPARTLVTRTCCVAALLIASCDRAPEPESVVTFASTVVHDFGDSGEGPVRAAAIADDSTVFAVFDPGHEMVYMRVDGKRFQIGRKGPGPGEFLDAISLTSLPSGDVIAVDATRRVALLWSPSGELKSELSIDFPYPGGVWSTKRGPVLRTHNRLQTSVEFRLLDFSAGQTTLWRTIPTSAASYETCRYCSSAVGVDGRIALAAPDTLYSVARWNASGDFAGTTVRRRTRVLLSSNERDSLQELRQKARNQAMQTGLTAADVDGIVAGLPTPKHKPRFAYNGLMMDPSGYLLVQPNVHDGAPAEVDVYSQAGGFCGTVALQAGDKVLSVKLPLILLSHHDPAGSEALRLVRVTVSGCVASIPRAR